MPKDFVVTKENFEFVISKSIQDSVSLLKRAFCFIILYNICTKRKSLITLLSTSSLKSTRLQLFCGELIDILTDLLNAKETFVIMRWTYVTWCNYPFLFSKVYFKSYNLYITVSFKISKLSQRYMWCHKSDHILSIISNLYSTW